MHLDIITYKVTKQQFRTPQDSPDVDAWGFKMDRAVYNRLAANFEEGITVSDRNWRIILFSNFLIRDYLNYYEVRKAAHDLFHPLHGLTESYEQACREDSRYGKDYQSVSMYLPDDLSAFIDRLRKPLHLELNEAINMILVVISWLQQKEDL